MAYKIVILLSVYCLVLLPLLTVAQSNCGGPCTTVNDCAGQLTCINGQCTDDPSAGTNICGGSGGQTGSCQQSGTLTCDSGTYPTYDCSPPVTTSTSAILTNNDFSNGGDGGAPSECDQSFHENTELIVALSTGWYDNGSRCFRMVRITASNGNSVDAKVIDECDSRNGCDAEHAGLPPCRNNIVDGSNAVWEALGLNTNDGEASITWSLV